MAKDKGKSKSSDENEGVRKVIKVSDTTAIVIEPFKNEYGSYIGIREFWKPRDDTDGEWRPSKKGLSIPEDKIDKVCSRLKWAVENMDDAKTIESKFKGKKSKDEDDDEDDEPKSKSKKKGKK
jgi:hypothetical protein